MNKCYNSRGNSLQELLCQFSQKINENVNLVNSQEERIKYLLNQGILETIISKKLPYVKYYKNVESMKADRGLIDGMTCITQGYYEPNDGGGAEYITHDGQFKMIIMDAVNVKQFGAKGDGATDESDKIQSAIDTAGVYKKIIIPKGTYIITKSISPLEGQTLEFFGSFKLKAPGAPGVVNMLGISKPNITLINPMLDMDREHNYNTGAKGSQTIISCYTDGYNLTIKGGKLTNGIHNGIQGGRSGLKVIGTTLENFGEHAFYLSGLSGDGSQKILCDGVQLDGITIKNVGLLGAEVNYAHGFKLKNIANCSITNCYMDLGSNDVASFYFEIVDKSTDIHIDNCVGINSKHKLVVIEQTGGDNFTISNSSFTLNKSPKSQTLFDLPTDGRNIKVSNCVISGYNVSGQMPTILENCVFLKIAEKIDIKNNDKADIINCKFDFTTASGDRMVDINNSTSGKVKFQGCKFIQTANRPGRYGFIVKNIGKLIITDCDFDTCVNSTISVDSTKQCYIKNNSFIQDTSGSGSAVSIGASVNSGVVVGNTFSYGGNVKNSASNVIAENNYSVKS